MNTDTLLIVVIFSTLGAIVLLFILIRVVKSLSSTSNPLPPPQPLAHHREQELENFHDSVSLSRPHSWYNLDHISTPQPETIDSESSLLSMGFRTHSHRLSGTDEGGAGDYFSVPPVDYSETLAVPNPRFHARPASSSSYASSSEFSTPFPRSSSPPGTPPPLPPLPSGFSEPPGPMLASRPRISTSSMGSFSGRRQRPISMSSMHSIQSKSGRRGLPHGPHSQMHIILPAPLAPEANPVPGTQSQGGSPYSTLRRPISRREISDGYDRRSMVDRWVPTPSGESDIIFFF